MCPHHQKSIIILLNKKMFTRPSAPKKTVLDGRTDVQLDSKYPVANVLMRMSVCSIHVKMVDDAGITIRRASTSVFARLASPERIANWSCRLPLYSCHRSLSLLH